MTRSLTIVNTSNWYGENYDILTPEGWKTLQPGERTTVAPLCMPGEATVGVRVQDGPETRPFKLNGEQVLPVVHVGFER